MKTYKPLLIVLVCALAASVVGNFHLYTSLSSANAQIEFKDAQYGTLESDVESLKGRVATLETDTTSLQDEIAELKNSKLLDMLSHTRYLNEIRVGGALFNYGTDAATGISIKMTWYDALNNKVYEATIVVEDIPGGHWRQVSATYSYVELIDHWSYTIHWDQGEISYP